MANIYKCHCARLKVAFTLIELLVVIAVISILAALLLPTFLQVRERGRQTVCLSNIGQFAVAFMQYNEDNDERFPIMGYEGPGSLPTNSFWHVAVQPYVKNRAMEVCPSDPKQDTTISPDNQQVSYLANDMLGGGQFTQATGQVTWNPVSLARVASPSDTILLTEGRLWAGAWPYIAQNDGALICGVPSAYATSQTQSYSRVPFHHEGANFAFVDGHAKWYKVTAKSGLGWVSLLNQNLPWEQRVNPTQIPTATDPTADNHNGGYWQ